MRHEIVVARYREELDWLLEVPAEFEICLYEKGDLLSTFGTRLSVARLPNVGRESHTYLHHIVENYSDLADFTVFLQGYPLDHTPNLYDRLKEHLQKPLDQFIALNHLCSCDSNGMPQHQLPLRDAYKNLFGERHKDGYDFVVGAQFIVPKRLILSRSIDFYRKALAYVSKPEIPGERLTPHEAYVLERFWRYIFGAQD